VGSIHPDFRERHHQAARLTNRGQPRRSTLSSAAPQPAWSSPSSSSPSRRRSVQAARRPYRAVRSARPFLRRGAEQPRRDAWESIVSGERCPSGSCPAAFLPASSRRRAAERPARPKVTPGHCSRGSLLPSKLALSYIWKFTRCYRNTGNSK